MCDAKHVSLNRPVLRITNMMVQLELMDIRQVKIMPDSPRLSTTVLARYLTKQREVWQPAMKQPANVTKQPKSPMSQLGFHRECFTI